ncbi:MAG: GGDEF domain-containing protein, partial [Desulfobulbaceae bacterium]|nr:GGDEF domain-containing protein [Desulfobulbaceae bacterium]
MVLGYMPVILVTIVIAAVSLQGLQELDKINKNILRSDTVLVQLSDRMVDNLLAQEAYGRRFLILKSQEMQEMFWQRGKDFETLIERVYELPDQRNIPIAQLASLHDEFEEIYKQEFSAERNQSLIRAADTDHFMKGKLDEIISLVQTIEETAIKNQQQKMLKFGNVSVNIFRTTLMLSGLGVLLGLGAVTVISRSVSRSIRQLRHATEEVSQGKFTHLAEIKSQDEFGELAKAFNYMTSKLGRLEELHIDSNPLTRLPGGVAIENVLKKRLESGAYLAFCMLDLDNFKSFNDRYGYTKGNEVIRATADLIKDAVAKHGTYDDFVGHIGGDDFAIIVKPANYKKICETIIRGFDLKMLSFYKPEDKIRGYIEGVTRQGLKVRSPLMSISIAVVTNENVRKMNYIEVAEIAAELKEHAKSLAGSVYVVNRRGEKAEHVNKETGFMPKV